MTKTDEIDDFMWLLKNLRGGITQIVKRHAKVDIGERRQAREKYGFSGICYLDANNLYRGAMHRMIPYELMGIPGRQEKIRKINQSPNKRRVILITFDKYFYIIECDVEVPGNLYNKFNDL